MELTNYIIEQALILIPVLLVIGSMLKLIPKIPNWIIPWVLLCIGVLLAILIIGFTVDGFIQGVLVAGAAVFTNQLYKQTVKKDHVVLE